MPHSLLDAQQLVRAEQQAEQQALIALRGVSFHECLMMHSLTPEHEVHTLEERTVTLRGNDIYDHRTWKKFLTSINQSEIVPQLTGVRAEVTKAYTTWLLHEHIGSYRALSSEADLAWLERVVTLAVTRRIMEQKYEAYAMQGLPAFADPQIAYAVGHLWQLNHLAQKAAWLIYHTVKEPEQARLLTAQFYEENECQMRARLLLPQRTPPVFQPGDGSPLALPTDEEVEEHHE